jgi:nicotinamidase-related amidase
VLPVIGRLAQGARDAGVLVVHLTAVPAPLGREATNRKPILFAGIMDILKDWDIGDPRTEVVPEIGVDKRDLVLARHSGLSPTHGTETFKILRNFGITTLVVTGVSTNIALPVVLTEAVDEGFDVIVPRDAVAGSPAEHSESMLKYTIGMIATLTTTDDLLAAWA